MNATKNNEIAALFVRKNSIYKNLVSECYDEKRNALNWPGGCSIIAHPPCQLWGQLSHFSKQPKEQKYFAIWAVEQIRKFGGVLEHPHASKLWNECNLPKGNQIDQFGGFTFSIDQSWFGHKARKKTLLYIVGCKPSEIPKYPISFDLVEYVITTTNGKIKMKECTKKEREETPLKLAQWLIELTTVCNNNLNKKL